MYYGFRTINYILIFVPISGDKNICIKCFSIVVSIIIAVLVVIFTGFYVEFIIIVMSYRVLI